MFDIFNWTHIVILLGVALVVVGPKDLPRLMHMAGRWAGKARGMANEFKRSFDEMARQTELDELRKEVEALKNANPLGDMERSLNEAANLSPSQIAPYPNGMQPAGGADMMDEPRAGEFQVTDIYTHDDAVKAERPQPAPEPAAPVPPQEPPPQ